ELCRDLYDELDRRDNNRIVQQRCRQATSAFVRIIRLQGIRAEQKLGRLSGREFGAILSDSLEEAARRCAPAALRQKKAATANPANPTRKLLASLPDPSCWGQLPRPDAESHSPHNPARSRRRQSQFAASAAERPPARNAKSELCAGTSGAGDLASALQGDEKNEKSCIIGWGDFGGDSSLGADWRADRIAHYECRLAEENRQLRQRVDQLMAQNSDLSARLQQMLAARSVQASQPPAGSPLRDAPPPLSAGVVSIAQQSFRLGQQQLDINVDEVNCVDIDFDNLEAAEGGGAAACSAAAAATAVDDGDADYDQPPAETDEEDNEMRRWSPATEAITSEIYKMLEAARSGSHDNFSEQSRRVRQAVLRMTAIAPRTQAHQRQAVDALLTAADTLSAECRSPPSPSELSRRTQQVIQCCFDIAKAAAKLW
uniref:GIT1_C domain-containing protein n=1 Tax=Macrostomum lignano TaxID=282301 RepID=A0A1I8FAX2_9PLAT